jgi:hypothetical protein
MRGPKDGRNPDPTHESRWFGNPGKTPEKAGPPAQIVSDALVLRAGHQPRKRSKKLVSLSYELGQVSAIVHFRHGALSTVAAPLQSATQEHSLQKRIAEYERANSLVR